VVISGSSRNRFTVYLRIKLVIIFAFQALSIIVSINTVFRQFNTVVITIEVVSCIAFFADLLATQSPFAELGSLLVDVTEFGTVVIGLNNCNWDTIVVTVQLVTSSTAGTVFAFIDVSAVGWVLNTFIVRVKIINIFTHLAHFFTPWSPIRIPFALWTYPPVFSTMINAFNSSQDTESIFIKFISFFTFSTDSLSINLLTIFGERLAFVLTVKVEIIFTLSTDDRAISFPVSVLLSFPIKILVLDTMVTVFQRYSFNTKIGLIEIVSFVAWNTDLIFVMAFAVEVKFLIETSIDWGDAADSIDWWIIVSIASKTFATSTVIWLA
jgi:hypothetical protein